VRTLSIINYFQVNDETITEHATGTFLIFKFSESLIYNSVIHNIVHESFEIRTLSEGSKISMFFLFFVMSFWRVGMSSYFYSSGMARATRAKYHKELTQ